MVALAAYRVKIKQMPSDEKVLYLGLEGGGADIFRTPVGPGVWQFFVKGSSMDLDENDDECWRYWQHEPVETFEEALESISPSGSWIFYFPVLIHRDYRAVVWARVELLAAKFSKKGMLKYRRDGFLDDWRERCSPDDPGFFPEIDW